MTSIASIWQRSPLPSPRRKRQVPSAIDSYVVADFLRVAPPSTAPSSNQNGSPSAAAAVVVPKLKLSEADYRGINQLARRDGESFSKEYLAIAQSYGCPPFSTLRASPATPRGQLLLEASLDAMRRATGGATMKMSPRSTAAGGYDMSSPASNKSTPRQPHSYEGTPARGESTIVSPLKMPSIVLTPRELPRKSPRLPRFEESVVALPSPGHHHSSHHQHGQPTPRSQSKGRPGGEGSTTVMSAQSMMSPTWVGPTVTPARPVGTAPASPSRFPKAYSVYAQAPTDGSKKSLFQPDFGKEWDRTFDADMMSEERVRMDLVKFDVAGITSDKDGMGDL